MKNARPYDPLVPVKCHDTHHKILMLVNYEGGEDMDIGVAKFFLVNAKVLKDMKSGRISTRNGWLVITGY